MKNILTAIGDLVHRALDNPKRQEKHQLFRELQSCDEITLPQAYAMLLVDMALIDQTFDAREYDYIFRFFRDHFEMNEAEIRELVQRSSTLIANMRSSHAFAEHLSQTLSTEEREKLMSTLAGLVAADEVEDGFEIYLKGRFRELLGLNQTKDSADTKEQ